MRPRQPLRGEIWLVDLYPTRGREQSGHRPALVLSTDALNRSGADLLIVLPITSAAKAIRSHVRLDPPEGGVSVQSFIKCEDIRSISKQRLTKRWGAVSPATLRVVGQIMRDLLEI